MMGRKHQKAIKFVGNQIRPDGRDLHTDGFQDATTKARISEAKWDVRVNRRENQQLYYSKFIQILKFQLQCSNQKKSFVFFFLKLHDGSVAKSMTGEMNLKKLPSDWQRVVTGQPFRAGWFWPGKKGYHTHQDLAVCDQSLIWSMYLGIFTY